MIMLGEAMKIVRKLPRAVWQAVGTVTNPWAVVLAGAVVLAAAGSGIASAAGSLLN